MMREPVDLRRALKEEVRKDLADFTFTPAMQQRVLAQIHKRPRSRLTWLYPASAAAAVLLILVSSTSYLRQGKAEQLQEAASAGAQQAAAAPVAPSSNEAVATKSAPTSEPAPTERSTDQFNAQVADGIGNAMATGAPETHALAAPGSNAKIAGKLAVTGPQMAAVPSQHLVVTISGSAVTRIDSTGAPVWQVALPATLKSEQVVTAPNGKIVVGAGSKVLLLGPDGSTLQWLQLKESVQQIATGPSDQLALVSEQAVYVRQAAGQPLTAIAETGVSAAAYTPEGLLLLVTQDGLAAYGPNGNRRWLATGDGGSLLVSKEGKVLLWGNALYHYDSTGAAATALEPMAGVTAGGPGLLRWDGEQLKAITWAGKQVWNWVAPGFINAIYREGERLWVVLDTPEGFKLQELKGATGRPVGEAQTLPIIPQEAIVMDGKLYLSLPDGLTVLSL